MNRRTFCNLAAGALFSKNLLPAAAAQSADNASSRLRFTRANSGAWPFVESGEGRAPNILFISADMVGPDLYHPERPLSKGFVRVTNRTGLTLTHAAEARAERSLTLHFGDGPVDASVDGDDRTRPALERKPRQSYIASQPGLFDQPEE